jgi:NADP-dependent 3-hydroxy acid dehydrogenase YdfG
VTDRPASSFADLTGRIGPGIASAFAEAGASIALNARSSTFVEARAAQIARASGASVEPIVGDATTVEGMRASLSGRSVFLEASISASVRWVTRYQGLRPTCLATPRGP